MLGMDTSNGKKTYFAYAFFVISAFAFAHSITFWVYAGSLPADGFSGEKFSLVLFSFMQIGSAVLMYFFARRPSFFFCGIVFGALATLSLTDLALGVLFSSTTNSQGQALCAFSFINWILLGAVAFFTLLWRRDLTDGDQANSDSKYEQHGDVSPSHTSSAYSYDQPGQDPYSAIGGGAGGGASSPAASAHHSSGSGGTSYAGALQGASASPYAEKDTSQNV